VAERFARHPTHVHVWDFDSNTNVIHLYIITKTEEDVYHVEASEIQFDKYLTECSYKVCLVSGYS